jgi:hypothetical protein
MALLIAIAGLTVAAVIWLGPETRGRKFVAIDEHEREGAAVR